MDFTQSWHWPQWAIVALIALRFVLVTTKHGQQKLEVTGPNKGQPERYNGFAAIFSSVVWFAILICGGFFA